MMSVELSVSELDLTPVTALAALSITATNITSLLLHASTPLATLLIESASALRTVGNFDYLTGLRSLTLANNGLMIDVSRFALLESLYLAAMPMTHSLQLGNLRALRTLDVHNMAHLNNVTGLDTLSSAEEIRLYKSVLVRRAVRASR
jgi:hypothetical protein